jgi:two-component system chemotaxis sensor kinase CheA
VKETTLRVDTGRFDQILNLSGEIGLTRNRLSCISTELRAKMAGADLSVLEQTVGRLDTLVGDLQMTIMKARMQPVGRVFQKYVRMARDLARQLGKDVDLILEGEDTEIDKTMLEELNDPMVHLLRNAFDHGIEKPQDRVAAGKPARGTVRLAARQEGDQIVIEISDDGRGMRPEVLRAKAIEKGLLSAEDAAGMDDRRSLNLIFLPGFSTSAQISSVSGRGVGMDVVKTNIGRLKGRIDLASTPGKGSRVTIALPLTLAILPALMLEQSGQPYAIPLSIVREVVEITPDQVQQVGGRPVMVMRGEVLPVADLRDLLGLGHAAPANTGVIVSLPTTSVVVRAGRVLGQDEVMVKPLEGIKPRGVAGATLSGSGDLVLVLELQDLLDHGRN